MTFKTGAIALLVLGLLVFARSFTNAFVLDDENQIVNNEVIHSPANLAVFFAGSTMTQASANSLAGSYYKPLMTLAYSLLWWMTPGQPFSFHLFQVLIFALNSILAFLFLSRHFRLSLAWILAAVYLVHPLNSEIAYYIADLQDALYTCFGLIALNWIAWRESRKWKDALVLATLLSLSILSKESGALYIFICAVYAFVFRPEARRAVFSACSLVTAGYLYLRLGHARLGPLAYQVNQIGRADLVTRLLTAPKVLFLYLFKFVFPYHLTVTQDWVIEFPGFMDFWLPLAALLAVLVASIWYARERLKGPTKDSRFAFFTFWVFAGMGFHSHILVPLDGTLAERWAYFPALGLLAMIGVLVERERPRSMAICAASVLTLFSVRTFARGLDWQNNFVLCQHDVRLLPDSYDLHNNLGVELFRHGQIERAKDEFIRSTELAPSWDVNWSNLGATYMRLGDSHKAEEYYLKSMQNGTYFMAYENYAGLLVAEGRFQEALTFIEQQGLPRFPASQALNNLYRQLKQHEKEFRR